MGWLRDNSWQGIAGLVAVVTLVIVCLQWSGMVNIRAKFTSTVVPPAVTEFLACKDSGCQQSEFDVAKEFAACFTLKLGKNDREPLRIVVTNSFEQPKATTDTGVVGWSHETPVAGHHCYSVAVREDTRPLPYKTRHYVWVLHGSGYLARADFWTLAQLAAAPAATPQPPSPVASSTPVTVVSGLPTSQPPPTGPGEPDLSLPPPRASGPSLQITSVKASEPARVGRVFEFRVIARNSGTDGWRGSISVSAPNGEEMHGDGTCTAPSEIDEIKPGRKITTIGNGTADGRGTMSSEHWAVELGLKETWPAASECALTVRATVRSAGALTFRLRAATYTTNRSISVWPYGAGPNIVIDQQGYRAIEWVVPVQQQ